MTSDPADISAGLPPEPATGSVTGRIDAAYRPIGVISMALLLTAYAVGLVRQVDEPWVGLHDWNGAFYSQLARNLIRYPFNVHHGMPLVAIGGDAPADERSIYATHPAGLVWVTAAAFRVFGECETAARLIAILASLITLGLWVGLIRESHGREIAILSGLIYSLLPMSVYFGRMLNHEALCLCGMIVALFCWQRSGLQAGAGGMRWPAVFGCLAGVLFAILIDWVGVLFAGFFGCHVLWQWRRGRAAGTAAAVVLLVSIVSTVGVVLHIVYGGLEGRWSDLVAIFTSRSATIERDATDLFWLNTVDNLTMPVIVLGAFGLASSAWRRASKSPGTGQPSPASSGGRADGVWVLAATGLVWLVVFRRQYQIHQYWAFYLGPLIALWAAQGILVIQNLTRRFGVRVSAGAAAIAILAILFGSQAGVNHLYSQRSLPEDLVEACQKIRNETPPGQRIVLMRDPVAREAFGGYVFRNIIPPQLAYYLDRPYEVRAAASQPAESPP